MTVRQEVGSLVRLGALERGSTSGTRVTAPGVVRNLAARAASRMTEMVERAGARPSTHLLRFEDLRAEGSLARSLMDEADRGLVASSARTFSRPALLSGASGSRAWSEASRPSCFITHFTGTGLVSATVKKR